jgi:uncharacterized protein (TIGR03083 family)
MGEMGDAYAGVRERVTALVREAGDDRLQQPSPATPGWTAHDVLAHLVGVTEDVVDGRLDGIATDPWTQAQVDRWRDRDVPALLAAWDEYGPRFEALMDSVPRETAGQAVFDAFTHEQDLRLALGRPGARDSDAMAISWSWIVDARTRAGAVAVHFVTEVGEAVAGAGEPVATVRASRFDLLRAFSGRRTASEIAAFGWDGEPRPELMIAAPIFSMRDAPLGE